MGPYDRGTKYDVAALQFQGSAFCMMNCDSVVIDAHLVDRYE